MTGARTDDAVRRDVLDAACRVFARAGYEAAAMTDIVEQSGYAVGTVYNRVGGKSALFAALSTGLAEDIGEALRRGVSGAPTAAARIDAGAAEVIALFAQAPQRLAFVASNLPELRRDFERVPAWRNVRAWLIRGLRSGAASGVMRELDPELQVHALLGGLVAVLARVQRDPALSLGSPRVQRYLRAYLHDCLAPLDGDR